jgi:hypothetical protein
LEDSPHYAFKLVGLKLDEVVKGVSNSLALKGHGDTAHIWTNLERLASSIGLPQVPGISLRPG